MRKDILTNETIVNNMEKKGINTLNEWKMSLTGTFAEYKDG